LIWHQTPAAAAVALALAPLPAKSVAPPGQDIFNIYFYSWFPFALLGFFVLKSCLGMFRFLFSNCLCWLSSFGYSLLFTGDVFGLCPLFCRFLASQIFFVGAIFLMVSFDVFFIPIFDSL
jgi:hypothetical protein